MLYTRTAVGAVLGLLVRTFSRGLTSCHVRLAHGMVKYKLLFQYPRKFLRRTPPCVTPLALTLARAGQASCQP